MNNIPLVPEIFGFFELINQNNLRFYIMSIMTTVGIPQMSDYAGRIVEITVTGVCRQDVKRVSSYTVKVPHSRMNEAMREIYLLGGKVADVKVL